MLVLKAEKQKVSRTSVAKRGELLEKAAECLMASFRICAGDRYTSLISKHLFLALSDCFTNQESASHHWDKLISSMAASYTLFVSGSCPLSLITVKRNLFDVEKLYGWACDKIFAILHFFWIVLQPPSICLYVCMRVCLSDTITLKIDAFDISCELAKEKDSPIVEILNQQNILFYSTERMGGEVGGLNMSPLWNC